MVSRMQRDSLSEVLELVGARATMAGGFVAGGRWAIAFPAPHTIKIFAVAKGEAHFRMDDTSETTTLRKGDAFLLAAPRAFTVASDFGVRPLDATRVFRGDSRELRRVGTGEDFVFLGGHVTFDAAHEALMAESLPSELLIRAGTREATTLGWLIERLVDEVRTDKPGVGFASTQLAQLMFLEVFRTHVAKVDANVAGRLRVIADRRLSGALAKMHDDPARAWHVDDLAKAAGMSRTAFAVHFKDVAGISPLAYLTEPPVSGKLSPPPRSGVRASLVLGA
jgi:hypothetical protein